MIVCCDETVAMVAIQGHKAGIMVAIHGHKIDNMVVIHGDKTGNISCLLRYRQTIIITVSIFHERN